MKAPGRPQEQRIVDQVVVWLGEILQTNGYHTNAGFGVSSEEYRQEGDRAALLTVTDSSYTSAEPRKWSMTLDIEGVFPRASNERQQARLLLNDIGRALFRRSSQWRAVGAGVTGTTAQAKQIDRQSDGGDYQRVLFTLVVEYSDLSDAPPGA